MSNHFTNDTDVYVFKWNIKNLEVIYDTNIDNVEALKSESVSFSFKTIEVTNWMMTLRINENETDYSDVTLTRKDDDGKLDEILFNMNLSVVNENGEYLHQIQEDHVHLECAESKTMEHFLYRKFLKDNIAIVLEIKFCEAMFNVNDNQNSESEEISRDLQKLLENDRYADVTIVTADGSVKAHRCLLENRWPLLVDIVTERENSSLIHVNCSSETINSILKYIYSGKFEADLFDAKLFKAALATRLSDIVDHYIAFPNEKHITTEKYSPGVTVNWLLDNADICNDSSKQYLQEIHLNDVYSRLFIIFDISKCQRKPSYHFKVSFHFFPISTDKPIYFIAELAFTRNNDILYSHKLNSTFSEEIPLVHEFFLNKSILVSKELKFSCAITACDNTELCEDGENCNIVIDSETKDLIKVDKLKSDLGNIFEDSGTSDTRLICENKVFHVHAAVLSSRSPRFDEILSQHEPENSIRIEITDIKSSILELLLHYIYGIQINEVVFRINDYTLYAAAVSYKMYSLAQKCTKSIVRGIRNSSGTLNQ